MYFLFLCLKKDELDKLVDETADTQVETLQDIMGDIIISIERVEEQSKKNMDIVLKENLHICLFMDFIT